jgi:uncharacterized repeat protein (TIGR03837 family)
MSMSFPASAHIFCRVIDNFGDIGVCWRLARQLHGEHGLAVTLWVDDLISLQRLCPVVNVGENKQDAAGVLIRQWSAGECDWSKEADADLVVEAFACDLPEDYVLAMTQRHRKPVWINLEYLSAESWVEGCHALPSPHPNLPLIKYFFFPGFSSSTGGLLREQSLFQERDAFQSDMQARCSFLASLGIDQKNQARLASLFCYPTAPVAALFSVLSQEKETVLCLVPEGVAADQVSQFLQQPACSGASARQGNLEVRVIPFLTQPDYDRLLWCCDLNFVRGEDSVVRAQWAGRPFIWHIYPQQDGAHWPKLDAFLERYTAGLSADTAGGLVSTWHAWNGGPATDSTWQRFFAPLPELRIHTLRWAEQLQNNGDLTYNLLRFAAKIG